MRQEDLRVRGVRVMARRFRSMHGFGDDSLEAIEVSVPIDERPQSGGERVNVYMQKRGDAHFAVLTEEQDELFLLPFDGSGDGTVAQALADAGVNERVVEPLAATIVRMRKPLQQKFLGYVSL